VERDESPLPSFLGGCVRFSHDGAEPCTGDVVVDLLVEEAGGVPELGGCLGLLGGQRRAQSWLCIFWCRRPRLGCRRGLGRNGSSTERRGTAAGRPALDGAESAERQGG
jgi:hypothetical protein